MEVILHYSTQCHHWKDSRGIVSLILAAGESVLLLINQFAFIQWTPGIFYLVVFPSLLWLLGSSEPNLWPSFYNYRGSYGLEATCLYLTLAFILAFYLPFPVTPFSIYISVSALHTST